MPRLRTRDRLLRGGTVTCVVVLVASATVPSVASATSTSVASATTMPFGYDLVNDPDQCINFLPRPDCGRKAQQAGDRGGPLQYLLFGIMLGGLGVIGTVIIRNVIRRDRAMAAGGDPASRQ